jgi:cell division protein FtsL
MEKLTTMLKEHVILLLTVLLIALVVSIGLLINQSNDMEALQTEITNLQSERTTRDSEIATLIQEKEALIKQVAQTAVDYDARIAEINLANDALESKLDVSFTLPDYVLEGLVNHGFKTPLALLEDLATHDELLPVEGVLGGSMKWWPEYSVVLNEKYVFGYFEDGHILGYALLKYSFDKDDNLKWQVIDTYMD